MENITELLKFNKSSLVLYVSLGSEGGVGSDVEVTYGCNNAVLFDSV